MGGSGCGICAQQTDAHVELGWGFFSLTAESVAGLGWCRCCCSHPRGVTLNESAMEIVLDESGEVQGTEVVLSQRGAAGCGILAGETDFHLEKCWGLTRFDVPQWLLHAMARAPTGLDWCLRCSHPRGVTLS